MPVLNSHGDRLNAALTFTLVPVSIGTGLCISGAATTPVVAAKSAPTKITA